MKNKKQLDELNEKLKKANEENNKLQLESNLLHKQIYEMESQIEALVRALGDANEERKSLMYALKNYRGE